MPKTNEPADVFRYYAMQSDDECWPWLGAWGGRTTDKRPYFMSGYRRQMAYRWVYELYHGVTLTPDQVILHSCDRGSFPVGCGNVHHMRLGTPQDNVEDRVKRNRQGMTDRMVHAIRSLLDEGKTQQEVADLFGVSRELISAIATQRKYRHVT